MSATGAWPAGNAHAIITRPSPGRRAWTGTGTDPTHADAVAERNRPALNHECRPALPSTGDGRDGSASAVGVIGLSDWPHRLIVSAPMPQAYSRRSLPSPRHQEAVAVAQPGCVRCAGGCSLPVAAAGSLELAAWHTAHRLTGTQHTWTNPMLTSFISYIKTVNPSKISS